MSLTRENWESVSAAFKCSQSRICFPQASLYLALMIPSRDLMLCRAEFFNPEYFFYFKTTLLHIYLARLGPRSCSWRKPLPLLHYVWGGTLVKILAGMSGDMATSSKHQQQSWCSLLFRPLAAWTNQGLDIPGSFLDIPEHLQSYS